MRGTVLALVGAAFFASSAFAQSPAVEAGSAATASGKLLIPEGTEMEIRFDEVISSKTSVEGDRFRISLADPVTINGVTIPAGYGGRGTVVSVNKRGFMGKAGDLNISLDYLKIGETKLRIRAHKGKEGRGAFASTVALTVLFGPLGLLKRGQDATMKKGQTIIAYLDRDEELPLPLAPAPTEE